MPPCWPNPSDSPTVSTLVPRRRSSTDGKFFASRGAQKDYLARLEVAIVRQAANHDSPAIDRLARRQPLQRIAGCIGADKTDHQVIAAVARPLDEVHKLEHESSFGVMLFQGLRLRADA